MAPSPRWGLSLAQCVPLGAPTQGGVLPEVRAIALLWGALPVERVIFVRRRLFARGINGRLQCTRTAYKSVWRLVQMIGETCLFIFGAWACLAEEGHPLSLHRVE